MLVSSGVLIPEVLPAVMPQLPALPEFLPAAPAAPALPSHVPGDLPPAGRRDAATFSRVLGDPRHAQQVDDVLCAWTAARARDLRPGMRKHLRVDGRALRGAARGGRAPMLLSGLWDDGTTAAQLPVHGKTNEIPVFRDLLEKIPAGDLKDAVISADQMHTQRKHAGKIEAAGGFFIFTIR